MNRIPALILLALPLLAAGCESPGSFPSLAKRPAERMAGTGEMVESGAQFCPAGRISGTADPVEVVEAPPPPLPPSASLQASVDQLLGQAARAHSDFEASRAAAERAVSAARGAARASEGWVSGQVALAGLESRRSGAVTALTELDLLYAEERIANPEGVTPSAELLGKAREQVMALVEAENAVLARLGNILGS
jgi:hypothetical protein